MPTESAETFSAGIRCVSKARLPELLAPAGDWECARAAVENGADAIYFGLERFNARMRARNFTVADLPKLMSFLHRRGVKGYVTFNTLVFADELAQAQHYLQTIIAASVDAAIVQDVGICRMIRKLSPDFPIHASTQMTITSAGGVEFAWELGCNLVVLARECSLKEIEKIQTTLAQTPSEPRVPRALPLEVFVHGALCVAYSGQCLTSESLGGRSANRGECAQACRMPYELIADGRPVPLGDKRYLLSPQDLAGLEVLPELLRAGVASLKIEGRLKSPEYVANITRVYRQALDSLVCSPGFSRSEEKTPARRRAKESLGSGTFEQLQKNTRYDLEMAFSRGLHTGWFEGINNQALVHARFGKKRGVFLGTVSRIQDLRVMLELEAPLKLGDGVVFDAGHPEAEEQGGRVYQMQTRGREAVLQFGRGQIDFSRVQVGDRLWKTSDPELDRRVRQTFAGDEPKFTRPLHLEVFGGAGHVLTMIGRDELGHVVQLVSRMRLAPALKQPLTAERLRQQFGRLGGTPFTLENIENHLEGDVILPISELNRLRRKLIAELESLRTQPKRWRLNETKIAETSILTRAPAERATRAQSGTARQPELLVLVRNFEQLDAALACDVGTLYCEFEDPKKYRLAVERVRQGQATRSGAGAARSEIFVAPPRIFKMGDEWILKQVRSCEADGYLVRNYDHLKFFADTRRVGDFSLNVSNPLTADYFVNNFRLERVTASYDLNVNQLEALLRCAPAKWFEITIHQHMPMFHMEHCVFCAFLSQGTDFTNCGRPCDTHRVELRDRVGAPHPLKADAGCRNTVFNALAQTGAEYVGRLLELGVHQFRLEFLNEPAEQVALTIRKYRQLLAGEISGSQLWRELKLLNQLGVTRGQF